MIDIIGGEGIILHNKNIVLGMQKEKRWYNMSNGQRGAVVKTIGGQIEKEDNGSLKNALIRETMEEIKNISLSDIIISPKKIFEKEILMKDLNPFEKTSNLKMKAKFYLINIKDNKTIFPNDLPFLFEIPIKDFIEIEINKIISIDEIKRYMINTNNDIELPEYISLFIPIEVKEYLRLNYNE